MKPFFSIEDLEFLLDLEPLEIADGLTACGVPMTYNGTAADLSDWYSTRPGRGPNGELIAVRGNGLEPSPESVMVATRSLPDDWKSSILAALAVADEDEDAITTARGWPWGRHETRLLRHLAAAATKFWSLYDPDDPTTAPTNQEVKEWLMGQGVAERNAQIMATILRADDLPTGPRK